MEEEEETSYYVYRQPTCGVGHNSYVNGVRHNLANFYYFLWILLYFLVLFIVPIVLFC